MLRFLRRPSCRSRSRRRVASPGFVSLLVAALSASGMPVSPLRAADVTIDSAVGGPQVGQGGLFTVTTAGSITGEGNGIEAGSGGTAITTLDVQGRVDVGSTGVSVLSEGSLGTLTNSGTVQGANNAVNVGSAGTITTLSNLSGGSIAATLSHGILVTGTVTSISNAGSISAGGSNSAVRLNSTGVIGSIINTGTISGGSTGSTSANGIGGSGPVTSTIDNSGLISGGHGVRLTGSGTAIGTIINRTGGVIRGSSNTGITIARELDSITNQAGGLIEGQRDAIVISRPIASITNAGIIRSGTADDGIIVDSIGTIGNLTNSGTIQAGEVGLALENVTGTVLNTTTGVITASLYGYRTSDTANAVVNEGQIIAGRSGIWLRHDTGSLVNRAGGVISSTATERNESNFTPHAGLTIDDVVGTLVNEAGATIEATANEGIRLDTPWASAPLVNDGLIRGGAGGVRIVRGTMTTITNSGTIAYTGTGTGPAVFVGTSGTLGNATGAGGPALVSTGTGALLGGTIVNKGTIHHGFTIANQDVTVSADGGVGTFTGGLLNVVDGNLTFTGGRTTLDANVSVDGGTGTVFNEAMLAVLDNQSITGNFTQTSAGTTSSIITDPATFGSLSISGAATFAGMLDLDLAGAFALAEGQVFNLFSFGSYTGDFSGLSVDGVALTPFGANRWLSNGLVVQENWSTNGMSVSVAPVPEPSTFALGAAGIACAAWLRHRRRAAARKAA